MAFRIVADSSCDLRQFAGTVFRSVPLHITTEETEYTDDAALSIEDMVRQLRAYHGPSSTACPGITDWEEAFTGEEQDVYAFPITAGLSGSYNSAMAARELVLAQFPEKNIYVFDTKTAGPELVLLMEKVRETAGNGMPFGEVCKAVEAYQLQTGLFFALESLHNFAQNGRVSKLAAAAAELLNIRVLGTAGEDGTLKLLNKYRGAARTEAGILQELDKRGYAGGKLRITHCMNEEGALHLRDAVLQRFPEADVTVAPMGGLCGYYAQEKGILAGFEHR